MTANAKCCKNNNHSSNSNGCAKVTCSKQVKNAVVKEKEKKVRNPAALAEAFLPW